MVDYELSQILHEIVPYAKYLIGSIIIASICSGFLILGIIINNVHWKKKVFRFAKAEVIQCLEEQRKDILMLRAAVQEKDDTISELKGQVKHAKDKALQIIGK